MSAPGGLDLVRVFAEAGLRSYGESITQLAHALQCAAHGSGGAEGARLEPDEQLGLETHRWFGDAVRLRRWDDAAKARGAACPPLVEYASIRERHFGPQAWPTGAGIDR